MPGSVETFTRLKEVPPFAALVEEIELVVGPSVRRYLDDLGEDPQPPQAKALKDAVWGIIDLQGSEIVVLDSPPLQRLRGVRQLGLSYLTFPTAGYSRFEHTLGAVHQVERMLRAIEARSPEHAANIGSSRDTVRLAALMHDVGHMPLSHISERFYSTKETTRVELSEASEDITSGIARTLSISEPGLAECMSAAIIASPTFYSLLRRAAGYDAKTIAAAGLSIIGKAPTVSETFVGQLVSNVIDADKLDYMLRDGFVTRIPLAVDLERLLFKLKCIEIPATDLWGSLARNAKATDRAVVLGTDVAGREILYDLAGARKLLFERIYYHHKTRAAERVALRALEHLSLRPAELLGHDDQLFARYGAERFADTEAAPLIQMLIERRLPRRVFAAADDFVDRQLLADQESPDVEGVVEALRLRYTLTSAAQRRSLELEVLDEARRLCKLLGSTPPTDIWFDIPPDPISSGDARLPVVRPDGQLDFKDAYPPGAAAAVQNPLPITYCFASGAQADLVTTHVAIQRKLAVSFGLYFKEDVGDHAKLSADDVNVVKRRLEELDAGVFTGLRGLRPPSRAAHSADLAGRIEAQGRRFQQFSSDEAIRVDAARIRRFLDQFPTALVEQMLEAIEQITWLDRATLGRQFAERLVGEFGDASYVPLTATQGKSAGHLPYFLADHDDAPVITSLSEALSSERRLVVFDDVLISGRQSKRIVDTWFGSDTHEDAAELTAAQRASLIEARPAFRFAYGWEPGLTALTGAVTEYGLVDDVDALHVDRVPAALDQLSGDVGPLRSFLAAVGEELLLSTKAARATSPWDSERCEMSALGYNGDERLVVLEYNTPTGTITALWSHGAYDGASWLPLFPRRATST